MLGKVFGVLCILSLLFGAATGRMQAVSQAVGEGASAAVSLSIGMAGMTCLWSGAARVLDACGFTSAAAKAASPLFSHIYPDSCKTERRRGRGDGTADGKRQRKTAGAVNGVRQKTADEAVIVARTETAVEEERPDACGECAAVMAANFLGLGNAALPLGLAALRKMQSIGKRSGGKSDEASEDMITFSVLATVPFQLLPASLAVLRQAAGSTSPYEILLPVWISQALTIGFAVLLCRTAARVSKWRRS